MFKCNICQPERIFNSDISNEIHNQTHKNSEKETTDNLIQQSNDIKLSESYKNLEEVKMGFLDKFKPQENSLVEAEKNLVQQQTMRSYICELHLEVTETKDKKFIKVLEELTKKLLELINDGNDIVIKHQKVEKQF